jgi:hypothetical protein
LVEALGFYLEEDLSTLFTAADQPGVFEDDKMLGNRLAGEGHVSSQRPCTGLTVVDQKVDNSATRRVGDGRPQLVINLHRHLEAIQELGPPARMLVGITLLFCVGPVAQFMTALGHSKTSLLVAHGCQRELDEHRIAGHWFLPAGIVPAERQASRWIYGLHDDGAALVPELHIAMSARFDDEVDPVSERQSPVAGAPFGTSS